MLWAFAAALAAPPDFARDVRPILQAKCFACHDARKGTADFRLDLKARAFAGGESGQPAIMPGNAAASPLHQRVVSAKPDFAMPPKGERLTGAEADALRRWIDAGAAWPDGAAAAAKHWAFVPPLRPAEPATNDAAWPRNAIDRFVLRKLEREGLAPAPPADPATWLRRVGFDLTGLPPTPAEIDALRADAAPGAKDRAVDRLLASPRYGERWARWWLDAARYADSDGFEKDLPREQWAWREWVVRALNRDLGYDRFLTEQLAGDLLPGAGQDQRVATGFLRNGMVNEEGAILAEQFRMEGVIDRLDVLGKSVLGLTVQCAQCHTHKFDPISHEEYYRLFAFLNNDFEARDRTYFPEQLAKIADLGRRLAEVDRRAKELLPDWRDRLAAWEKAIPAPLPWTALVPTKTWVPGGVSHPDILPDGSILGLGHPIAGDPIILEADTKQRRITGFRLETLVHGDLPFGGPGRSPRGAFAVSELKIRAAPLDQPGKWQDVKLVESTADFSQPEALLDPLFSLGRKEDRRVGPAKFLVDNDPKTAWGADAGPGRRNADHAAVARFGKPVDFPAGVRFEVQVQHHHFGAGHQENNMLGRFRCSVASVVQPVADPLPPALRRIVGTPPAQRSARQQAELFAHWRGLEPKLSALHAEAEKLWAEYPEGGSVLSLQERTPEHRRRSTMLIRGDWQKPGKPVAPGVPAALNPLPAGAPPTRLGLALWLADRRSPTTARVVVNRVWQAWFGAGLLETSEDFGTRAPAPSHPELLDWLAVEFMDSGWSLKRLNRLIALSATYGQTAKAGPELRTKDPANRLLARGPRLRLEAEMVRDGALFAAGLLHERLGGPSFFPPVPESYHAAAFTNSSGFWKTAAAPERYRRSLYLFRRRANPDPTLATLDAPSGEYSCPRRTKSNTPLAALATMNDPMFVEAARALALRLLREAPAGDAARADLAYRLCAGRGPIAAEAADVLALVKSAEARYAAGWLNPREAATGDPAKLPALPPGATPTQAAAWTVAARVLLNLDETVTKN